MNSLTLEEISAGALQLPLPQRAVLVERLQESLGESEQRLSPAWTETVLRRRDELRSGRVKGIPGEEVAARIRQSLANRR